MTSPLTPAEVEAAQVRAKEAAAQVIALDSAARSAELTQGDEFASALRQCKRLVWTAAIFSGGVNLLFLASPIYLTEVYNRVIPSGSVGTLVSLSIGLVLAMVTMAAFDTARARILIRAAARLDRVLAHRVFGAIIELAPRNPAGRNAQMLRDLDQFRQVLAGAGAQFFFDVPWSPLFILVLFLIQPILGLVALAGAAVLLVLALVNNRMTRGSAEVAAAAANRSYRFTDAIARDAGAVRAMGMEDALAVHWHVDRDTMMRRQAEGSDRSAAASAVFKAVRLILQSAMIGVGALLVIDGKMTAASIFAANVLLGRALAPLELAVTGWRSITQAVAAGRRVQQSLLQAPRRAARVKLPNDDVAIKVDKVTFVPPGAKRPALRDVSLEIAAGEAVGIVGPSGAGKSCLARLLTTVTAPTQGMVTIGGVEGKHWTAENLHTHVGYLPQTVGCFPVRSARISRVSPRPRTPKSCRRRNAPTSMP